MLDMDWHIHSRHSPCRGAQGALREIARQAAGLALREFGVTDHLHCQLNVPAIEAARREFDALGVTPGFHFGVEVSCLREWDLYQNAVRGAEGSIYGVQAGPGPNGGPLTIFLPHELKEQLAVEYVIGGTHWPLGAAVERRAMIKSYHRQNMFLAAHPDVDIVAHPWWWMGAWENADGAYTTLPWFDDFGVIPNSMHREFAAAAKQCNTAVEINAEMLIASHYPPHFPAQYRDYLAFLKEVGVTFSVGSDAHSPDGLSRIRKVGEAILDLGLRREDLWRPPPKAGA